MSDKAYAVVFIGAIAGAVTAVGSGIPYLGACINCLSALVAGGAVVWYYTKDRGGGVTGRTGAGLGAGTAAVAALVNGAIGGILSLVGARPGWDEAAEEAVRRMRTAGSPEEQIEMVRQMFESPVFLAGVMGCTLILYALLGAIGGAIGASVFGEDDPVSPDELDSGTGSGPQAGSSGDGPSNREGSV